MACHFYEYWVGLQVDNNDQARKPSSYDFLCYITAAQLQQVLDVSLRALRTHSAS